MVVYRIFNPDTQKSYIGSTIDSKKRKRTHFNNLKKNKHSCKYLQNTYNKYKNLEWEIIEECLDDNELILIEQKYIDIYHSKNLLLNSSLIADNAMRYEDNRKKISEAKIGKGGKFGVNNPNYGNYWTDEQKRNASEKMSGKNRGDQNVSKRPEVRKKISEGKLGHKNPRAKHFILISPENIEHHIHGGIKRKMKEFGLSYTTFNQNNNEYNGWKLIVL